MMRVALAALALFSSALAREKDEYSREAFLRPARELLAIAEKLRAAGSVVEAAEYAYAAWMHSLTRGDEKTPHGKLLMPQYSLSEAEQERATALQMFNDDDSHDGESSWVRFTNWFNIEIQSKVIPGEVLSPASAAERGDMGDAIEDNDVNKVRKMLASGFDPNTMYPGGAVIDVASAKNRLEIVKVLLRKGADPAKPNAHGSTALHGAAFYGWTAVLRELINALEGRSPDFKDERGNTPLVAAATAGSTSKHRSECVKMLLDAGADPKPAFNSGSDKKVLPLLEVAMDGYQETVEQNIARRGNYYQEVEAGEKTRVARMTMEWKAHMARAVGAGAITQHEHDRLVEELSSSKSYQPGYHAAEQVKALKAGELEGMHKVGATVWIQGLGAAAHLNGERGQVKGFDVELARYEVQVLSSGKKVLVKPINLTNKGTLPPYDELVGVSPAGIVAKSLGEAPDAADSVTGKAAGNELMRNLLDSLLDVNADDLSESPQVTLHNILRKAEKAGASEKSTAIIREMLGDDLDHADAYRENDAWLRKLQREQDEILGRTGPPHARRAYDYRQRGYDDDE